MLDFGFRTVGAFEQRLNKGVTFNSTDYVIPYEMCAMINVCLDAKNQAYKLCAVNGVDVVSIKTIAVWIKKTVDVFMINNQNSNS